MLLLSTFFLFLLIPHAFSLNFIFPSFNRDHYNNISFESVAHISGSHLYLTTNQRDQSSKVSKGRATYKQEMRLWDKDTAKLANFNTSFTFVIDSQGSSLLGDGLTFFSAPTGSKLPDRKDVGGGSMGLIIGGNETILNSTDHPFAAVEFDIYPNVESYDGSDPRYVHVGVDINSMKSTSTAPWYPNITGGGQNEAFISYDASKHNLTISFTNTSGTSANTVWQHLHEIVDLTRYLPERVTFGFSAATGQNFATHRIDKWTGGSTLENIVNLRDKIN